MSESDKSQMEVVTLTLGSSCDPLIAPVIDSDEEEVFFGPVKSEKELNGKSSR
jgi:hypothetical protein